MVLYLKLDQFEWAKGDFTDSATYDLSGKIYRDNTFETLETSLDTFTGILRFVKPNDDDDVIASFTTGLTLNSSGTFTMTFGSGNTPYFNGFVKVLLRLTKSGSRLTAIGANGSNHLHIHAD